MKKTADELWIEDVAVEFGFPRVLVTAIEMSGDPHHYCKFECRGKFYEVHDGELAEVGEQPYRMACYEQEA